MIFDNLFIGTQQWRRVSLLPVRDCLSGIDVTISDNVTIVKGSHGFPQALFTLTIDGKKVQRLITVSIRCDVAIHEVFPLNKILIEQLECWSVGIINGKHIEIKTNDPYIYRVLIIK